MPPPPNCPESIACIESESFCTPPADITTPITAAAPPTASINTRTRPSVEDRINQDSHAAVRT